MTLLQTKFVSNQGNDSDLEVTVDEVLRKTEQLVEHSGIEKTRKEKVVDAASRFLTGIPIS